MDAHAWDERYAGREPVWSVEPNQFVARECTDLASEPRRAVDLAAGEGRNAIWLARQGWEVTAVDFSRTGLEKGRQLAGDARVEWVHADATTWRGTGYGLAVVCYLQLPAAERAAAVRNAFDALVPGGTFLLVAHDSSNLLDGTGGPQDPAVLMSAEDVLADLVGKDFDVVRAGRVERLVAVPDEHGGASERTAYDCLVRLTRR
ncbi:MAG TPA: class I SAM-dependent methyltransferase [Nocardioides sp.]|uniref:class I SAM-dependent methyltransferase n=1 Tax=Nocardioides sp. TaxID=35761 RepID=UPI002BE66702|nr:class I SAM-dependent methyltransferase [Nocardioides sp.]HQR26046.1 class I SAM-dependent methyltransferase [Nocardioides sp.]